MKTYISPELEVVDLETAPLLSGSTLNLNEKTDDDFYNGATWDDETEV